MSWGHENLLNHVTAFCNRLSHLCTFVGQPCGRPRNDRGQHQCTAIIIVMLS